MVFAALAVYLAFAVVALVESYLLGSEFLLLIWPHIALLALQEPLGGMGEIQVLGCLIGGSAPVAFVAWLLGPRLEGRLALIEAAVAVALTLFSMTVLSWVLAFLFAWGVGV